jgi:hypothetical protein
MALVQVAGCVNTSCIIYLLPNLSILRPCSRNALLAQIFRCVCCLCYGRVTSYPRFPTLRRRTNLRNPNPKHYNYMYNLNANPTDGAGQRA